MELEQKVVVILEEFFFESLVDFMVFVSQQKNRPLGLGCSLLVNLQWHIRGWMNPFALLIFTLESLSLQADFSFLSNNNREEHAQQCISYLFYCVKIHREKHPLRDREDCSVLNYLSSLGRAEEVLSSDSITKSIYSKYLHYFPQR